MPSTSHPRLAMFLPSLRGGGAERMMVNLLCGMTDAGIPVDLILAKAEGPFLADVPASVRVIDFGTSRVRSAIRPLARYLRRERPYAILSRMTHANLALLAAKCLARVDTRVLVIEASTLSSLLEHGLIKPHMHALARWLYPRADKIVAVSAGVARDLERRLGLQTNRVRVIYNPVVDARLLVRAAEPCLHPWLTDGRTPVLVSVGRLGPEKDHATLLRAFAIVRQSRPARLVIFGEGAERNRLESLRTELQLEADIDLPGAIDNPYAALRRASLFVLSSRFEGLPNVLIEALACGCPAASTDCPSGPSEVLDRGHYGLLAPPGEPAALASAMAAGLDRNWNRALLAQRGAEFSVQKSLNQYLEAIDYPRAATARASAA